MANGYLGKISAIVSANTADFDGKLNRSAKEVNAFAGRVQSNLTSASRQAAKALEGIYTPLQRFERSLQAAGSLKLSFKGFPGMIKDLDGLQQRLNSVLSKRQVDIVLKTTGMSSVSAVREAISGLKSKDVEIITRLGGLDKLKELNDKITVDADVKNAQAEIVRLTAVAEAAKAKVASIGSVPVTVKVSAEGIKALKTELDGARAAAGKLMGGEFMGDKSLNKAISGNIKQLSLLNAEISRVSQRRATLETMSAGGPGTNPDVVKANRRELGDATGELSSLGKRKEELAKNIAELEKYRDTIKKLMREIKQAEAGGGATPASGGDRAAAEKEKEAAIKAVTRAAKDLQKQIAVKYGVDIDISSLNELIARGAKAGDVLGTLGKLAENLGKSDFDMASDKMRKFQSVASQITGPLEAGVKKLGALSVDMATAYHPALKGTQRSVEQLNEAIQKQVNPSPNLEKFLLKVQAQAELTIRTFDRMVEVFAQIGQVKTGKEFVFEQPRLNEAINRGGDIGNRAAALPAEALRTNPAIAQSLVDIRRLSDEAGVAYAKFLAVKDQKQPTGEAQKELDAVVKKLLEAQAVAEKEIKVHLDTAEAERKATELVAKLAQAREQTAFLITGRPQNVDQAESRRSSIDADIGTLDRSQRQNLKPLLEAADAARATGDVDKINDALDNLAFKVAQDKRVNVKTAEAKKNLDDLKATMDSLRDESKFAISAYVQNPGQAEAEIKRIIGGMEKLDDAQRRALQPKVDAAISSLGIKDAKTGLPDIAAIQVAASNLKYYFDKELAIKVNKDDAQKSVDELKTSLASIADKIGDPSQPIDRLRQAVEAANAAIAKMPAGAIKAKLQADLMSEKVGLETMSTPSAPKPPDSNIDAAAARANAIAASATAATPAKATANPLGADFGTAERSLASLQSNVVSLQGSLEKLPMPMQTQFIPAINKVRDAFQKLTPTSTAAEIEAVTKKAAGLERAFARAGQAAKFGGTIGEALNSAAIARTEKQLGFVRSKLLEVGATASGPVANAFNAYSAAAANAAKSGTSGTAKTKQELDGLIAKIGEALVAEGKLTAAQGKAFNKNVGDVGRAGADKFALGLNQAAFAIDDFMSSTGGLEFKLRAISNNITQLGFVVGGTTGLFVGLGAVIAGQAAIGIIKWINNGRSAEDQTKALNEALARQKSLVEELAQAFESLGDAISRGTLSAAGEQAADFSRQTEEIKKKQAEVRKNRVAELDPKVQQERAEQNKLKGKLEKETNIGSRTAIQAQIRASAERERQRSEEALRRGPPGSLQVRSAIAKAREVVEFDRSRRSNADPSQFTPEAIKRRAQEAEEGIKPLDPRSQRQALEKQIADLTEDATGFGPEAKRASEQRNNLEVVLANLELPLNKAIEDLAISLTDASRGPSEQIRQAQEEVAKAIEAGLPGARIFGAELDKIGGRLAEATKKLREVVSGKDASGNALTVDEKEALTKQAQAEIAALQAQRAEIASKTDAFAYERTVDPQRQIEARMGRARSNLGAAGLEDGRIARRMREIEDERANIKRQAAMPENDNAAKRGFFEGREAALNEEAAAIEAATIAIKIFADALNRASEEAKGNLNSAQQRADETRRADLGNSTPQTQEARKQAEADLERQREIERAAQTEIEVERDRLVQMQQPDAERMQQIDKELKSGRNPGDEARERLVEERAAVEEEVGDNNALPAAAVKLARKRNEAAQAAVQANLDLAAAARGLGIDTTGQNTTETRDAVRAAGRGDIADEFDRRIDEADSAMVDAGFTFEERGATFWDTVTRAGEELAAALAHQAEVVNEGAARLAEMDAQIAAVPAGAGRETLIREREALQAKMEDDARASQAKVDAARDASTREAEQAKSGERGRELTRTPEERFKAESEQGLADIQNYFERRAEANNRIRPAGDAEAQAAAEARFRRDQRRERLAAREATPEGRGETLGMTERERFRRDFAEGAGADINARAQELRDKGRDPTKFLRQALANQMESVAPMLQGFKEERQNAALQGPSRAALNVSDVSTSQGASELTRLLRGDDSAKDVNLAELQKQSGYLEDIRNDLKANNPGVLL